MGKEIERKFLVKNDNWRYGARGVTCRQGYLNREKERTVRIRIIDNKGFITVKGMATGLVRPEFEYEIPLDDAETMLNHLCEKPVIEKIRYKIPYKDLLWEVDEFLGENRGLVLAEVELASEEHVFEKPEWIGKDVTALPQYLSSNLVIIPFSRWQGNTN